MVVMDKIFISEISILIIYWQRETGKERRWRRSAIDGGNGEKGEETKTTSQKEEQVAASCIAHKNWLLLTHNEL